MKIFADDRISHEAATANPGCPHCQTQTPMTPVSRPDFTAISACKPRITGLSFLCLECNNPVLVRYSVEHIGETEIELGQMPPVENRPDDRINLNYLPAAVKKPYVDALGCYQHELIEPFGLMCRQTMQAIIKNLGEAGKMKVFNQVEELREMLDIDPAIFDTVSDTLFDNKRSLMNQRVFGKTEAAVALEVLKDILYQLYVRKNRLERAFSMRQFFASQGANITPLRKPG